MKIRHIDLRLSALALALLPALVLANPPPTKLQPGLWQFRYHSAVDMAGRTIPPMNQTAQQCIKETDPAKLPLMPALPANIKCTAPDMQTSGKGYHVTMSCTASEANGMVSKLREDFMISPSHDGSQIAFYGTVQQTITGAPVSIPAASVKISAQGHRIGICPAPKR
ncbi:MAG: DUF3617 domain-containing protein [Metallibacterium sp.]